MAAGFYREDCEACRWSRGEKQPPSGMIRLDGYWMLNHYAAEQAFLGWMALQPTYHRMELTDLETEEARALGRHIQNIDMALRQYWSIHFDEDPIQRVYVVYFFEGVFDVPRPKKKFHLHMHLIPRPVKLDKLLREELKDGKGTGINAWNIYKLHCQQEFPVEYRRSEKRVNALMTFLRGYLWRLNSHDGDA